VVVFLQALCRISRQTPGVFQNVLEKVGAPKIRAALAQPVTRVQQSIITMILGLVTSDVHHRHFLLDKVIVCAVIKKTSYMCFDILHFFSTEIFFEISWYKGTIASFYQ